MPATLADHARAFYEERGISMPLLGTPAGDIAYRLWAELAFSNMSGRTPEAAAEAMRMIDALGHWWYECAVCGCTFPIWWVHSDEWEAGGFKDKHVCKECFEQRVPHPRYYSVDEYMEDTDSVAELIQKQNPNLTPDEVSRVALDLRCKLRAELVEVWNK